MRVIIAGGRDIEISPNEMAEIVKASGFTITTVVSGTCEGVDQSGEGWANCDGVPVRPYPADWNNLQAPGAVIKRNKFGRKYNAKAGIDRNEKMAQNADALIAVWDGKSKGTKNMIETAKRYGLKVYVHETA